MAKKKKSDSGSGQDLRNQAIFNMAASGKSQSEIADEIGLTRHRVNRILNSDEAKALIDEGRSNLQRHIAEAVQTLADAMQARFDDGAMPVAVKAATEVLKGLGVLNEKVKIDVEQKPFIMKLSDGGEIVMGYKKPDKEDER